MINSLPGKGKNVKVGKMRPGRTGEFDTKVKNKTFTKEIFSREIISLHITKGLCNYEETKLLFLNNVLSESLDNGTPTYYNSNILGRYMRKDYGNFGKNTTSGT